MTQPNPQTGPKSVKIAFLGNFGNRNLGNEATLRAILSGLQVRIPGAGMRCISTCPETAAAIYDIRAFAIDPTFVKRGLLQGNRLTRLIRNVFIDVPVHIYRWIWAIKVLRDTDMLILPGTQFLSDNLTGPWGWPYLAFRWCMAAKLVNCKLLFISVGAGPLGHPVSRFFVRSCLRLADFRSYRDRRSKQYVGRIGFDRPGDPVYPDLAFSLPMPLPAPGAALGHRSLVVAVGVKDYRGQYGPWPRPISAEDTYRRYIARMAAFISWLLRKGCTVRLVLGDVRFDTPVLDDLRRTLQAMDVHYDSRQLLDDPIDSMDVLISRLSASDIIVSPRFHNIIFGLLLHKPVLAISYHEKFSKLLESVDLPGFDVPIDEADSPVLIERFSELERRRDELVPRIRQGVDRQRAALGAQYDAILQQLPTAN